MDIIKNLLVLIASPRVGWEDISLSGCDSRRLLQRGLYPLLILLAVCSFVPMVYDSTITFTQSVMRMIVNVSSYFFGFHIADYLLGGFYPQLTRTELAMGRLHRFVGYCTMYLVVLSILQHVLPIDFTPVFFMMMYMMWIAYRGIDYLELETAGRTKFLIFSSLLLLLIPVVISMLLGIII